MLLYLHHVDTDEKVSLRVQSRQRRKDGEQEEARDGDEEQELVQRRVAVLQDVQADDLLVRHACGQRHYRAQHELVPGVHPHAQPGVLGLGEREEEDDDADDGRGEHEDAEKHAAVGRVAVDDEHGALLVLLLGGHPGHRVHVPGPLPVSVRVVVPADVLPHDEPDSN